MGNNVQTVDFCSIWSIPAHCCLLWLSSPFHTTPPSCLLVPAHSRSITVLDEARSDSNPLNRCSSSIPLNLARSGPIPTRSARSRSLASSPIVENVNYNDKSSIESKTHKNTCAVTFSLCSAGQMTGHEYSVELEKYQDHTGAFSFAI